MAWQPDYCTVAELKSQLRITDTADDTALGVAATAASRAIDQTCNRQFGVLAAPAARYYEYRQQVIQGRVALEIDDLMTATGLTALLDQGQDGVYEKTLTYQTDYDLWPWNAAGDGKPWTHMVFRPLASAWPAGLAMELKVTAAWGWTAVPTIVKQACLIQAARFFVRRDSSYGIAGSPETGTEMRLLERLDPDVAMMLSTVKRSWGAF